MVREYKLSEIADIITGPFGSMLHKSDYVTDGIPIIMPQNIGDRTLDLNGIARISDEDASRLNKYRVTPNDLVYARRGDVEKHAFIVPEYGETFCGTGCLRVRIDESKAVPLFVSFYLNRPECKQWISMHAVGSNMPNINTEILSSVPLHLPEIETQNKIVEALDCIDKKILNNQHINDNLEQMAMSIFNHWFTQFDFPDDQGNPYKSSSGDMIWDASIKKIIPLDWKVLRLEQVIENICTGLNPRDNFTLGNGNIRYVTVKNLTTSGTIDFSGCDMIDETARSIVHNRSDISIGDILFASIAPLGRCFLIQDTPQDWDINESVFSIRANTKYVTPEYLYMYFMSDNFIKGATSSSTGSIFKGIRIGTLQDTLAVIPPLDIINAYSDKVRNLLALQSKITSESVQLIKLRDWLLPMLMNGQATIMD